MKSRKQSIVNPVLRTQQKRVRLRSGLRSSDLQASNVKRPEPRRAIGTLQIGTSGWTYLSWQGLFYPKDVPNRAWLSYYAGLFPTTEINASFYRTPALDAVRAWRNSTPDQFTFSWKASRFITHWKRLNENCNTSIALMETRLQALGPKLLAVLFQLPPQLQQNIPRLASFLKMLPRHHRYAFEFRHKSWYNGAVFDLLKSANVALCLSDHRDAPAPWEITADLVYVRGHGPTGRYQGSYSTRTLERWADAITAWSNQGRDVVVYFDNDQKAAAPTDARRLRKILAR